MATDITELPDDRKLTAPAPASRPSSLRRRLVLGLILLLAAFCNVYELQREGFANLYYSAAIRSMLSNWHNFFFVSFDPGGFVTLDKPPLGFWIQTASAKIFGYSGFSILLPEALAGIASVGMLYVLVRRLFGTGAGLLAALFLAITLVSVVTNRNNTIDSLLVLTVLLAAYALSRAAETASLRWLLLSASSRIFPRTCAIATIDRALSRAHHSGPHLVGQGYRRADGEASQSSGSRQC